MTFAREEGKAALEELGAQINQKHEKELDEMHVEYQSEVDRLSQEVYERGIVVCYDRFVRKAFGNGESIACMGAAADHIGHGVDLTIDFCSGGGKGGIGRTGRSNQPET